MLDEPSVNDLIIGKSIGHEQNKIDIYSASWGPKDNGQKVAGPGKTSMKAIIKGINEVYFCLFISSFF